MDKIKTHFAWITSIKGLAIFLVVFGHFYPAYSPDGWVDIRTFIYSFHIPLFFFASGCLWSQKPVKIRVVRLLIPFLLVAFVFAIIKTVAQNYLLLENPVSYIEVFMIFVDPYYSYAPFLWFLPCLFFMSVLTDFIGRRVGYTLMVFSGLIFLLKPVDFGLLNQFQDYYIFYVFGVLFGKRELIGEEKHSIFFGSFILIVMVLCSLEFGVPTSFIGLYSLLYATLIILFFITFFMSLDMFDCCRFKYCITFLGRNTMAIYLFHTLFLGVIRVGMEIWMLDTLIKYFYPLALMSVLLSIWLSILTANILRKWFPPIHKSLQV